MMKRWNGHRLANYLTVTYGTRDPRILAGIYGFDIQRCYTDKFTACYSICKDGKKEILINESVPSEQIPFHIGKQLALFLLRNPEEIERT